MQMTMCGAVLAVKQKTFAGSHCLVTSAGWLILTYTSGQLPIKPFPKYSCKSKLDMTCTRICTLLEELLPALAKLQCRRDRP